MPSSLLAACPATHSTSALPRAQHKSYNNPSNRKASEYSSTSKYNSTSKDRGASSYSCASSYSATPDYNAISDYSATPDYSSFRKTAKMMTKSKSKSKSSSAVPYTTNMQVHISGIQGLHPLAVGVAYWYRGHYLYSAAGVPIIPDPFSTKKGVHLTGLTADKAPPFRPHAPDNVPEHEIGALRKSMINMWEDQERTKHNEQMLLERMAFGAQKDEIESLLAGGQKNTSNIRNQHGWVDVADHESEGQYNDRAWFLAQSAPGSHHGSPTTSRAGSPNIRPGQFSTSGGFRTVASTSELRKLQEASVPDASADFLPQKQGHFGTIGDSRPNPASAAHSRFPSAYGLVQNTSIRKDVSGPMMSSQFGRNRADSLKAAGIALNAAVNDPNNKGDTLRPIVLKCPVHGGDCDGVTVTHEHLTLVNGKIRGFKEIYPMIHCDDRTMIDWLALLEQEQKGMDLQK